MHPGHGLEELSALMPVPPGAGEAVTSEQRAWLLDEYPADYVEFITTYGAGTAEAHMSFLVPEALAGTGYHGFTCEQETPTAEFAWERHGTEQGRAGEPPAVIAWGSDSMPFSYCWIAEDDDPNRWPVVVFDSPWPRLRVACGMVEFLVRMRRGEYVKALGTAPAAPSDGRWRFVHRREQLRLASVGIYNPWT